MTEQTAPVRVTVAGGGIAGLSAALQLCLRGYAVTLYEVKPWVGGNFSSHQDEEDGAYHDVYPHMFSNFYVNFWDIVENQLGLKRDDSPESDFEPRQSLKMLSREGGYAELRNAASADPRAMLADMFAGVGHLSPLDMYLYLYSMLDLMVHRFEQRGLLGLDLNAFIRSRPTVTTPVAALHDAIVTFIWSVHANATSAAGYQSFYRHAFGNVQPLLWLLRGSVAEKIMQPLEQRLRQLGCNIYKGVSVQRVVVDKGRVRALDLVRADFDLQTHEVVLTEEVVPCAPFDHLVLAVSPGTLGRLANEGGTEQRLAHVLPLLSHAGKRLPAEPIAVLDLYFKRKLVGLPKENVAATDSTCYFTYIDLSQLWPQLQEEGITALTLAASDYWALPSNNETENAFSLVREFASYVNNFNPGKHWEDADSDIDWERTHYHSNKDDVIFVNQVGSWKYRPEAHYPEVRNLFFAGDFCRNHIDMATLEAAVTSGINAAAALQQAQPLGEPVELLHSPVIPEVALGALKLALAPAAYMAKAWLTASEVATGLGNGAPVQDVAHDLTTLACLPVTYGMDMLDTLGGMWGCLWPAWAQALQATPEKSTTVAVTQEAV